MNELFGIPMSSIMQVLVALLALCLLVVAFVAWRRPVIFKLGVRNIPRRPAQTILIVVGLMLSTLIMAAALGVGDTFDHSLSKEVYDLLGPVDEVVVAGQDGEGEAARALSATIPGSALATVEGALGADAPVEAVLPFLLETVPVQNTDKGQGEPAVYLAGTDPARLAEVGGLVSVGGTIDLGALAPDEVIIAERTADALDAEIGDALAITYNNQPSTLRVAGIAHDSILLGQPDPTALGMLVPLARLQELTGRTDALSFIAVSNAGDARAGADQTDAVVEALRPALSGGLAVDPLKQDLLEQAELGATLFTGFFLVLGLFSIAAGILLIILIFTMLAAERRPEMGMARAVGAHRRQLFQQFVSEGTGYALPAGVVGALLGVAATYGIALVMRSLFGDFFPIEAQVTLRSLVVAFCLGVVITFLAIAGASWKISRLNVVAAVRDIPDVSNPRRKKRTLAWGALLLLGGAGLILLGQDSRQLAPFTIGATVLPFGAALILRFFGAPGRPVFTIIGLALLVFWLMPDDLFREIFGNYTGDFEMFFVSGICMVLAATIVVVNNLDRMLAALRAPVASLAAGAVLALAGFGLRLPDGGSVGADLVRLLGLVLLGFGLLFALLGVVGLVLNLFPRVSLPAVRTAIAYPGAAPGRTGLTVAMFSLIVFSLVMIATMSENFANFFLGDEATAGWDVRADAGSANPIADFTGTLEAAGVDTSGFAATGVVTRPDPGSRLRMPGGEFKPFFVNGADEAWLDHTPLTFQMRAEGYADDATIREALRTEPNVAVVDASAIPGNGDPAFFTIDGLEIGQETFAPVTVEVEDPDGQPVPLTVIGVLDGELSSLFGLYAPRATIDPIYSRIATTSYFVAAEDPERADAIAKEIEAALLANGVQATSVRDELEEQQSQFRGFLYLIQGFMGLGLVVGIAAVGVIAFRSVVERRQQIGVLRALGFQRSLVSLSFLVETAFIVLLGVVSGTALGILLARSLLTSDDFGGVGADFVVPAPLIALILAATIAVALVMAWVPARQAAGILPAEALRYE